MTMTKTFWQLTCHVTFVDDLYKSIIPTGTHKASSMKIAEAAKVIENIQRDVNIALINELSKTYFT